jgi:hypothetical protein
MSRAGKGSSAYGGQKAHGKAAPVAQHAPKASAASGLKSLGMMQDLQVGSTWVCTAFQGKQPCPSTAPLLS